MYVHTTSIGANVHADWDTAPDTVWGTALAYASTVRAVCGDHLRRLITWLSLPLAVHTGQPLCSTETKARGTGDELNGLN